MKGLLERCTNEVSDVLNSVFGESFFEHENTHSRWIPKVDVIELENAYVITADLPGVDKENLDVKVENNHLVISGKRETTKEVKKDKYHRFERNSGSFKRIITLNDDVNAEAINAEYIDGVLNVSLGKIQHKKMEKKVIKVS